MVRNHGRWTRPSIPRTFDWSRDDAWIVAGGKDGLYKVPVGGGPARFLAKGPADWPVWSPKDDLIVYTAGNVGGQARLKGVRSDGVAVKLPPVEVMFG